VSDIALNLSVHQLIQCRHYAKKIKLFANKKAKSQILGETQSRFKGRGMEFEEVREYHHGDDIRRIDWRITAKTQTAHTRLNTEDRERPILIAIDLRSTMYFASQVQLKSVLASKLASYIAWSGLASSDRITSVMLGDNEVVKVGGKRMRKSVLQILQKISELNAQLPNQQQTVTRNLNQLLETIIRVNRPGNTIYLISDFNDFDKQSEKLLNQIAGFAEIYCIKTVDPIENDLQILSKEQLNISNGFDTKSIYFNASLIAKFQAKHTEVNTLLHQYCHQSSGQFLTALTSCDPWQFLYQHFH